MKIAVVGGAGKVVWGAIRDFVENDSVEQLLLADLNLDVLEERKRILCSDKVITGRVDLNDHNDLVKLLDSYDVCLNATSHHFNLKVMAACVESRTHYTDFGGLFHWARQQLEMHESFKDAGITGIVGSGSAPGIVNVMARYGYDHLDEVYSVKILDGIVNFNLDPYKLIPPYAIDTLLDEFEMNPYEFKNGEFVEMWPFSGEEVVDFPVPVGRQKVINTIHSEVATIPLTFKDKGIRDVAFKLSLPTIFEEQLKFLVGVGLGSSKPVNVKGQDVVPRDLLAAVLREAKPTPVKQEKKHDDHKALRVEIVGKKDGQDGKYVLDTVISPYEKWSDMSQGVFSVGFPAAVTTRLLGSGQITKKGFFPSEAAIDPKTYFKELEKRGIKVHASFIQQV
ncbi:saccharopine dehydrogenase family protein [Ammoniphilus sp. YIM 78166]|uniref:saccharopine dehydrogenase family protein n=1 Tax=Ammoniphilus sp. YIM 78166 TaxID=1644106 RepID=UPI0010706785|nr:saccharopine dehydrogenase C-terminal domain-containing protein [Ammoniphilus sp. YIM 78166]